VHYSPFSASIHPVFLQNQLRLEWKQALSPRTDDGERHCESKLYVLTKNTMVMARAKTQAVHSPAHHSLAPITKPYPFSRTWFHGSRTGPTLGVLKVLPLLLHLQKDYKS